MFGSKVNSLRFESLLNIMVIDPHYHVYTACMSTLEVSVQMLLFVKALPAKSASPIQNFKYYLLFHLNDSNIPIHNTYHWLGRFCFLATCWGPNMSRMGWNGHSTGNFTWYLSNIGSHFDWTIFRTTRALSREHDILKTLGPGQGISDRKQKTITCKLKFQLKKM